MNYSIILNKAGWRGGNILFSNSVVRGSLHSAFPQYQPTLHVTKLKQRLIHSDVNSLEAAGTSFGKHPVAQSL